MDEILHTARTVINAVEAGRRPDVRRFREQVLSGIVLDRTECLDWIGARHAAEPPEFFPDGSARHLFYAGPYDWHYRSIATRPGGILEELRVLGERLARDFSWYAGDAVVFVLTDVAPLAPEAWATVRTGGAGDSITPVVPPTLTQDQLWRLYSGAREMLDTPSTRASRGDKTARLAIFRAEQNDGKTTLREAWERWKDANPEDDSQVVHGLDEFQKQSDAAYRRTTGREPPPWRAGRRGSKGSRTRPRLPKCPREQVEQAIDDARMRFLEDWRTAGGDEESLARLRRWLPPGPGESGP